MSAAKSTILIGVAAQARYPSHLVGRRLRIPHHRKGKRDEATGIRAAPFADVPVVVGADHDRGDVLVRDFGELHAGERRERREAERRQDSVRVHVADALVHVPTARPDLVVRGRLHSVLLRRATNHGVQGEVRDLLSVENPDVGAILLANDPRRNRMKLHRERPLEHVRGFDCMVVDANENHVL